MASTSPFWTPTSSGLPLPSHQDSSVHQVANPRQTMQAQHNRQQAFHSQQSVPALNALDQSSTPHPPYSMQSTRGSTAPGVTTPQRAPSLRQNPQIQQESRSLQLQAEPQTPFSQALTSAGQSPGQIGPAYALQIPPAYQLVPRNQSVSSGSFHQQVNPYIFSQSTNSSNTSTPNESQTFTSRSNSLVSPAAADLPAPCGVSVQGRTQEPFSGPLVMTNPVPRPENLGHSPIPRKSIQPQLQEGNVALFCRTCTHCRFGISYDTTYLVCRFCHLYICNGCSNAHPSTHRQNMFEIVSRQVGATTGGDDRSCSRCGKMVRCRHDCRECGATFCNDCQKKRDGAHNHRAFTSIEVTVSICSRCQSPIDLQQEAVQCKTCLITHDGTVNLCHSCHVESWASHDQSHEIVSLIFQSVANDIESGLGCRQCDEKLDLSDKTQLARHPHNSFFAYLGPTAREFAVNAAYRLCERKKVRKDRSQVTECHRCKHEFPSQTMRICAGDCKVNFCDECFPLASLSHVHGPTNFRSLNDEACPETGFLPDGWRAMRNSEGRNYYSYDETGHFTFEKPRLPDFLPAGWVAMKATHGGTVYVNKTTNITSHVSPIFGVAPEGWDLRQTETGRLFYVNRQTQITTWHKPEPDDGDPLPLGWERGRHADGRVYYINHLTKTNTWTRPTGPTIRSPSLGNSPALPSTHGCQSTMPMSTSMNPAHPTVRLPVVVPTTNGQNFGSPGTLPGSVTIIPPQIAPQMVGQNSVMVISAPQMKGQGQGPVTMISIPQATGQQSAQVPLTQSTHPQQAVTYSRGSQSAIAGSTLSTFANNPHVQKTAIHLGLGAINDFTTHPTWNPPSNQPTVSTNYGSFSTSETQNNSNITYANTPPAYMPTVTEDPSASITSSMANLMNSNNSQYQYSNNSTPSAMTYTVTDNSALTSSYYVVPQETYVQTQDVQTVQVSSDGTSSFTDYATVQTQIADYSPDVSVNTDYVEDTTITDQTTTEFMCADPSDGLI